MEEGQLPLAFGGKPSGHVVVSVVCCFDGDVNADGRVTLFDGGGGVEGGCAGPAGGRGFIVPTLVLAGYLVPQTQFPVNVLTQP